MKRIFAAITLALLLTCTAIAQSDSDPATTEEIQKLFEVSQSRKMMDQISSTMMQKMPEMVMEGIKKQSPKLSEAEQREAEKFITSLMTEMMRTAPYDDMMTAMIPVYQRHFTHGDVQNLLAFYSSPTGTKMLADMPQVMNESLQAMMPIIQKWSEQNTAQLQKKLEEFTKRMKEQQTATAKPAVKKS